MRLIPYGSIDHAHNVAKVGKKKTPLALVERMPSAELAAKVGPTTDSERTHRVVRLNVQV